MNITTINNSFSIFGNYASVVGNLPSLVAIFNGYQVKTFKERFPTGTEHDCYRFSFANKSVTLRPGRLDIEFAFAASSKGKDFLQFMKETVAKLLPLNQFLGSRIAFNSVEFIESSPQIIERLSNLLNVNAIFSAPASELSIRLNHVKKIGNEDFNSIITVQDGMVTNAATKRQAPAIFINKDINTVAANTAQRFALSDYSQPLLSMMLEAESRTNAIISKISEE